MPAKAPVSATTNMPRPGLTLSQPPIKFFGGRLIVKVKEPLTAERKQLRRGQMIFTYLHLAPDLEQTKDLLASGVTAIAYETVTDAAGKLPLLAPMSTVAGRMALQVAAHFLERPHGGRGILLGGADDVPSARVVILGGGVVGTHAAEIAVGMGGDVTIATRSAATVRRLSQKFGGGVHAVTAGPAEVDALCKSADVVVGAALVVGAAAPKLVSASIVKAMKRGAVIVDVSIDQGGCIETSATPQRIHSQASWSMVSCIIALPTCLARCHGHRHSALNNATRPFIRALADKGCPASADRRHPPAKWAQCLRG